MREAEQAKAVPSSIVKSSFIDARDGKRYRTVKIGEQVWMAENLNFVADSSWCYDNDDANCEKYGRLYNWDAAMGACPAGWRLPDSADWNDLVQAAGGKWGREGGDYYWHEAGGRLKSRTGWNDDDYSTGELGFLALPGGYRVYYAELDHVAFDRIGYDGKWWSATEDDRSDGNSDALSRSMGKYSGGVYGESGEKSGGLSVRCIQK